MIRILLFEDNKAYRQGLTEYLESCEGLYLTAAYADANEALSKVRKHTPDVILMDIQMPGISGIDALKKIRGVYPNAKVLIQTVFDDDHRVFAAICAGALGYVLKNPNPDALVKAIFEVNEGGACMSPSIALKAMNMFKNQMVSEQPSYIALTDMEKEVLAGMVKGKSYQSIADTICRSYHTVHFHIRNIYEKLQVNTAQEAVAKALDGKLI